MKTTEAELACFGRIQNHWGISSHAFGAWSSGSFSQNRQKTKDVHGDASSIITYLITWIPHQENPLKFSLISDLISFLFPPTGDLA